MSRQSNPDLKVFIGGLTGIVSQSSLLDYLQTFGPIKELVLLTSKAKDQNYCLGYAYALCGDEQTKATLLRQEHFFDERKIQIRPYKNGA